MQAAFNHPMALLLAVPVFFAIPCLPLKWRPRELTPAAFLHDDSKLVVRWISLSFQHLSEITVGFAVFAFALGGVAVLFTAGTPDGPTCQRYCAITLFFLWILEWIPVGAGRVASWTASQKNLV